MQEQVPETDHVYRKERAEAIKYRSRQTFIGLGLIDYKRSLEFIARLEEENMVLNASLETAGESRRERISNTIQNNSENIDSNQAVRQCGQKYANSAKNEKDQIRITYPALHG